MPCPNRLAVNASAGKGGKSTLRVTERQPVAAEGNWGGRAAIGGSRIAASIATNGARLFDLGLTPTGCRVRTRMRPYRPTHNNDSGAFRAPV